MCSLFSSDNIKVILRIRPQLEREYTQNCNCLKVENNTILAQSRSDSKQFTFDHIATEASTQYEIFSQSAREICDCVLEGYNGTIFVYGQTGSGKTYTLFGSKFSNPSTSTSTSTTIKDNEDNSKGILHRVLEYLFLQSSTMHNSKVTLSCSFLEIYMEQIADLLSPSNYTKSLSIQCNSDKVYVEGLSKLSLNSPEEAYSLILKGSKLRHIAPTGMNKESSRSHAVFSIYVDNIITNQNAKCTSTRKSVFHLVDLAGSERQKTTESTGERLKEAGIINKSLMNLSLVIKTLSENKNGSNNNLKHVHFRDSKLTLLLKDSLGGNAKTCIIANVSPANDSIGETLSTLSFASRAKQIKNKATINEETNNNYDIFNQKEIELLKEKIKSVKAENLYLLSIINKNKNHTASPNDKQKEFSITLSSLENEVEEMSNEIIKKKNIIDDLSKEEEFLKDKLQKLELDEAIRAKEKKENDEQIDKLNIKQSDFISQIKDYQMNNNNLTKEYLMKQNEMNFILMSSNNELNQLTSMNESLKMDITQRNDELQRINVEKNKEIIKIKENEEMVKKTKKEKNDIITKIEGLKTSLLNTKNKIKDIINTIENAKCDIETKDKKEQKIIKKIQKVKSKGDKYIMQYEEQNANIRKDIKSYEDEIAKLCNSTREVKTQTEEQTQLKDKRESEKLEKKKEIAQLKDKIEMLLEENEQKKKTLQKFKEKNELLLHNIKVLKDETNDEGNPLIENKICLLNKVKQENTKLKEELNEIKKMYNSLQRNFKNNMQMHHELFEVSSYLKEKDAQIDKFRMIINGKVEKLKSELKENGNTINKENGNTNDIEQKFIMYIDQLIAIEGEYIKEIATVKEENENKTKLIGSIKRELLLFNENLDNSLSLSSINDISMCNKRNSCSTSSLIKSTSHAKMYKTVFVTKPKYDTFLQLNDINK